MADSTCTVYRQAFVTESGYSVMPGTIPGSSVRLEIHNHTLAQAWAPYGPNVPSRILELAALGWQQQGGGPGLHGLGSRQLAELALWYTMRNWVRVYHEFHGQWPLMRDSCNIGVESIIADFRLAASNFAAEFPAARQWPFVATKTPAGYRPMFVAC
jgi:hypothetical protein